MIVDQEWGSLRDAWFTETEGRKEARQESDVLAGLKLRVKREGRRLIIRHVLGLTLAAFFLIHSAALAAFQSDPFTLVWAASIWVFTGWAVLITLRNRRGLWRLESETTRSFVEISVRRCEATLRSLHQGLRLFIAQLIFVAAFLTWKVLVGWDLSFARTLTFFGFLAGMATLLLVNLIHKRRRYEAELAEWRAFEKSSDS